MTQLIRSSLILALIAGFTPPALSRAAEEDLRVLAHHAKEVPPGKLLELDLKQQLKTLSDARRERLLQALQSRADCQQWARERREFFVQQLGGFPERTPLNARTVRRLDGQGYRVENVIFESRPGHHVTANLYLPNARGPFPGVLIPCGHSHNGKAAGGYQRAAILLARNGMAALCYDPIGQGERYQMIDFEHDHDHFYGVSSSLKVPHPRVQYLCTTEHTAMGLGCVLLGTNIAQFRIWDGMRAIDYLQSREDIIKDRIGCTGNSGGGTLTAYLMALDDRIVAAAPVCYLTTFEKLIETRGAQDAEQNIFGQIGFGMDEPDYVMMRAPRPTLICAGRRDVTFAIDGTWDLFRQAKMFYARLGYPERVDLNDADLPHGFYLPQREAAARWMHRWLLGEDKAIHEVDPQSLPDPITDQQWRDLGEGDWTQEELYCSTTGQVLLDEGERSLFQINSEILDELTPERKQRWQALDPDGRRRLVVATIGSRPAETERPRLEVHVLGLIERDGYLIHKLVMREGSSIPLPALAFVPRRPNGKACLYLHGVGMQADAAAGGPIEKLVQQGETVLVAELRGIGETETGHDKNDYGRGRFGRDVQEIFLAYLLGQSYVGLRVDDVESWTRFLKQMQPSSNRRLESIRLIATGEAAVPALHAAALQSGSPLEFASVTLREMIPDWATVVRSPDSFNQAANMVHGALRHYDLPDLVELVGGTERVTLESPVDALGQPLSP